MNEQKRIEKACAKAGISVQTYFARIRRGMSEEQALSTPVSTPKRHNAYAGEQIKFYRLKAGMTQKELGIALSKELGLEKPMTAQSISWLEMGYRAPSKAKREALGRVLGVDPKVFVDPNRTAPIKGDMPGVNGAHIREIRKRCGLTQGQAIDKANPKCKRIKGYSKATLAAIEEGRKVTISKNLAEALCKVYKVTTEEFFAGVAE